MHGNQLESHFFSTKIHINYMAILAAYFKECAVGGTRWSLNNKWI